jgi:ubiquinone/menaquinone biosynthesis C-methylase UbiE
MPRASGRSWKKRSVVDHRETYRSQADLYERLVAREDYAGHVLPALNRTRPLNGLDVVELGAGTGRLTRLVMPQARSILAFDVSLPMLEAAQASFRQSGEHHWHIAAADHRWLPVLDHVADVVLAGWTIGQHVAWKLATWQADVDCILSEISRLLRPGGTVMILETLGTGHTRPHPHPRLADYGAYLERIGFAFTWIRTDFDFESEAQAQDLIGFFFGQDEAKQMVSQYGRIIPECTGLWSLTV